MSDYLSHEFGLEKKWSVFGPTCFQDDRYVGRPVFDARFWKLFWPWFGKTYRNFSWSWSDNLYLIFISVRSGFCWITRKITEKTRHNNWFSRRNSFGLKSVLLDSFFKWSIKFSCNLKWFNKLQLRSSEVKCKNDLNLLFWNLKAVISDVTFLNRKFDRKFPFSWEFNHACKSQIRNYKILLKFVKFDYQDIISKLFIS